MNFSPNRYRAQKRRFDYLSQFARWQFRRWDIWPTAPTGFRR